MREVYVLSDLHVAAGCLADFVRPQAFRSFAEHVVEGSLILMNGDVFDFAQTPEGQTADAPPRRTLQGPTEAESIAKFQLIAQANPVFFEALQILSRSKKCDIGFTIGNHDVDLVWSGVQALLAHSLGVERLRVEKEISLPTGSADPDVRVFHGHQQSGRANQFSRWSQSSGPVVRDANNRRRVQTCWGSRFMAAIMNPIDEHYPYVDNIRPLTRLLGATRGSRLRAFRLLSSLLTSGLRNVLGDDSDWQSLSDKAMILAAAGIENPGACEQLCTEILAGARDDMLGLASHEETMIVIRQAAADDESRLLQQHAKSLIEVGRCSTPRLCAHSPTVRSSCKAVICGHTHQGLVADYSGGRYVNTGTWIPYLRDKAEQTTEFRKAPLETFRDWNDQFFEDRLTYAQFKIDSQERLLGLPELREFNPVK